MGALAEALDRLGWRTVTARGPYAAMAALADLSIEAAIVDLADGEESRRPSRPASKAACAPRRLPVIGLGQPEARWEAHRFDLDPRPASRGRAGRQPAGVPGAPGRRRGGVRAAGRNLRRARPAPGAARCSDTGPLRVLAVGEPAPQFLALSNALVGGGADVVGAFTAYTAFDYLHERRFEAVVLWAGDDRKEALPIATGMRRNTRLYHIPALLYLQHGGALSPAEAFDRGISDVASPETPERETARRVVELASGLSPPERRPRGPGEGARARA